VLDRKALVALLAKAGLTMENVQGARPRTRPDQLAGIDYLVKELPWNGGHGPAAFSLVDAATGRTLAVTRHDGVTFQDLEKAIDKLAKDLETRVPPAR